MLQLGSMHLQWLYSVLYLCMCVFVSVCMHVCVGEGGGGEGERGRGQGEGRGVELPLQLCVRLLTAVVCNRILYCVPSSCQKHSP